MDTGNRSRKAPSRASSVKNDDFEEYDGSTDGYIGFKPHSHLPVRIDGSSIKGTGMKKFQEAISKDLPIILGGVTCSIVVCAKNYKKDAENARIRINTKNFRSTAQSFLRFALYLQEPICIEEDDVAYAVILPKKSETWKKISEPLRKSKDSGPITQLILPQMTPDIHSMIATKIGQEMGEKISGAIQSLTRKIDSFSKEAVLVATGVRTASKLDRSE
ncbi:hypothetical protein [Komagataeibacter europaeus]|uniref:hypothetical protein n=1 Tax=Komagataeibacter europaeus TaxID=33995 RepID=UPI0012DFE7F5|nr:hypothetical protein [Komagataeibacter europaeus]